MNDTRPLTSLETKAINLVKMLEEATDNHRLTVTVVGGEVAARTAQELETKHKICRAMKVAYDSAKNNYSIVYQTVEFNKYVIFILGQCGLKLLADGSIKTADNRIIANTYLGER